MESTGLGKVKCMGKFIPANELDKAIMAMQRSQAALPELLRCLCEGDLWLLMPFHPEIANEKIEMKSGMPLPFTRLQSEDGEVVVAYSSEERAMEGLKKANVPPHTFMSAVMPALQVLEILGKMNLPMSVNRGCITGEVTLPPVLLRDLADGTALQPLGIGGKTEEVALDLINPADFPTDLLQPVFELFRKHKNFRAAWIFSRATAGQPTSAQRHYCLLLLMDPRDAKLFHDFNLVAQAAKGKHELTLSLMDEKDPAYTTVLFRQARPFYVAADFQPPDSTTLTG